MLPHPHVVDFDTMRRLGGRRQAGEFRVGMHVKSLRRSMDPLRLLPALVRAVRRIPGGVLQVNGHRDVLEPDGARYDHALADALRRAVSAGRVEVHVHDFLSDAALWEYLAGLDVSVLPYRFGTHSGWLEACRDLGTTVVAPSCGFFADQAPVLTYVHDESSYDARSLEEAVDRARYLPGSGRPRSTSGASSGPRSPRRTNASTGRCSRDGRTSHLPHRLREVPGPRTLRRRP